MHNNNYYGIWVFHKCQCPKVQVVGSVAAEAGKPQWKFWESIKVNTGDLLGHAFPRKREHNRQCPLLPLSLVPPTGNTAHQVIGGCFRSHTHAYDPSLDGEGQRKATKSLIWSLGPTRFSLHYRVLLPYPSSSPEKSWVSHILQKWKPPSHVT